MIRTVWDKISFIGLRDLPPDEAVFRFREIVLMNRLTAILQLILLLYLPVEVVFNGWQLVPVIVVQMIIVSLTFLFIHFRKFGLAKLYLFFTAIFATTCLLPFIPREAGNHYFLLAAALLPVILFKDTVRVLGGFVLVLIVYYAVDFTRDDIPDLLSLTKEQLMFFSRIFIFMLFLIVFITMFYFKSINREYEGRILKKTEELDLSQKIIAEKNKDITDSIHYAKRIQSAILPSDKYITGLLPEHFVLYQPKDIVAGDFYWFYKTGEHIFFAAADCTGHGVPGAMVSVVCHNALTRSILEFGLREPAVVLGKSRELIIDLFRMSDENIRDGMDISLCVLHLHTKTLTWAGANNPLWLVRDSELKEYRPDKQHVGHSEHQSAFTQQEISYRKGDILYLVTDGYSDQFGGEGGKKFKKSRLKELLLKNSGKEMNAQRQTLEKEFKSWKGGLEQLDDVCIIGVKL